MIDMKPCPFCGGEAEIIVCDDEGNIHDEAGYEAAPWSGLAYQIRHTVESNDGCPIAQYEEDGGSVGTYLYDSREEAAAAWNCRARRKVSGDA